MMKNAEQNTSPSVFSAAETAGKSVGKKSQIFLDSA
jgi:hypothetical protein